MSTSHKYCKVDTEEQKPCFLPCIRGLLPIVFLVSAAFLIWSAVLVTGYKQRLSGRELMTGPLQATKKLCEVLVTDTQQRPVGTEKLPRGIISATSELELRPLWGNYRKNPEKSMSLLAMAVGINQKDSVNKIVNKFTASDFVTMLFHYDGVVDEWHDLEWSHNAIHVSAINQTKWWFAKRFLHPDIVSEYDYIFLWDEDLGVENFNPSRFISIVREEGLEISQPALDPNNSEVHHQLTKRQPGSRVHRWITARLGNAKCDKQSSGTPCAGFVEMMAPVFSKAAWRCAWHMIQNDLVHAWGLDFQLGYCAQGDRTKNIGIVDSEYISHYGIPTLGGSATDKEQSSAKQHSTSSRLAVRKWSYIELEIFRNRWKKAVNDDNCWNAFKLSSQNIY